MYFLIDGYNLLFTCITDSQSFQIQRDGLLSWMQRQFSELNLSGIVVFDGGHQMPQKCEQACEISYQSPLEIAYTPKGQSADAYIIERLSYFKNTGTETATVVTNDKGLLNQCEPFRPQTLSSQAFVKWLLKKSKQKAVVKRAPRQETPFQIDRLTKIFEEKLKEDE
jgi:predicted RNA-binding protein with PIN domain